MTAESSTTTEALLAMWREHTPGARRRIHLNNAGASLMPETVLRVVTGYLSEKRKRVAMSSPTSSALPSRLPMGPSPES